MQLIILAICLSVSLGARASYFLESLNFERQLELEHVLQKVHRVAREDKHLVSLGESHLHPVTARSVQAIFVEEYLKSAQQFRFCAEEIKDFLEHPAGEALRQSASSVDVSTGNSPYKTDFRDCRTRKDKGYFTYSGFFHQLPFARPFPLEFAPTPVITADGENIRDQLAERNSLFIIQMELEYIEMVTQARLLRYPPESVEEFLHQVSALKAKVRAAKQSFKTILPSDNSGREKIGALLGPQGFEVLPLEAILLVTDLSYRRSLEELPLLSRITQLEAQSIEHLLRYLKKAPAYVTGAIQEPNENGELFETGYGTVPWLFPANSTFLEVRIVTGENMILTAAPTSQKLTCIAYKKLGPSIVDCNDYLQQLP